MESDEGAGRGGASFVRELPCPYGAVRVVEDLVLDPEHSEHKTLLYGSWGWSIYLVVRRIRLEITFPLDAVRRTFKGGGESPRDDQAFSTDGSEEPGCLGSCAVVVHELGSRDVEVTF